MLILKKIFIELLRKNYIRINYFLTIIPLFLIYKLGDRIYFYIDYYKLNTLIIKDQYLLSLIKKILYNISKI